MVRVEAETVGRDELGKVLAELRAGLRAAELAVQRAELRGAAELVGLDAALLPLAELGAKVRRLDARGAWLDDGTGTLLTMCAAESWKPSTRATFGRLVGLGYRADAVLPVSQAARLLYTSRRALGRALGGPLPTPQRVLAWGQMLRGAWRYGQEAQPLARVSGELHDGDAFAFSNRFHRYTGSWPKVWRDGGADLVTLCGLLVATWHAGGAE